MVKRLTLCHDTFEEFAPSIGLDANDDAAHALEKARALLSRVQQRVLPQMPDALTRQMGGMLFSHAGKVLEKNLCLKEPELFEVKAPQKRKSPAFWLLIAAAATVALCAAELWGAQKYLYAGMLAFSCAMIVMGMVLNYQKPLEKKQIVLLWMDGDKLMALMAEQMRMIDRDLEALKSLLPEGIISDVPDTALDALMKVYEVQSREGWPQIEIRQTITHFLALNGIEEVEYTAHNAPLFQTLPTLGTTRTLIPALLKSQHLVRQGLAICQKGAME